MTRRIVPDTAASALLLGASAALNAAAYALQGAHLPNNPASILLPGVVNCGTGGYHTGALLPAHAEDVPPPSAAATAPPSGAALVTNCRCDL